MKDLEMWLKANHPELLKDAIMCILSHQGWDLMDAVDMLDSHIYNNYCEQAD